MILLARHLDACVHFSSIEPVLYVVRVLLKRSPPFVESLCSPGTRWCNRGYENQWIETSVRLAVCENKADWSHWTCLTTVCYPFSCLTTPLANLLTSDIYSSISVSFLRIFCRSSIWRSTRGKKHCLRWMLTRFVRPAIFNRRQRPLFRFGIVRFFSSSLDIFLPWSCFVHHPPFVPGQFKRRNPVCALLLILVVYDHRALVAFGHQCIHRNSSSQSDEQ